MSKEKEYYIGLMSGTSIDNIDGILIAIGKEGIDIVATCQESWPAMTANLLHALCQKSDNELEKIYEASLAVAHREATLVRKLLKKANLEPGDITAIGSHGQTVRHHPDKHYSAQLDSGPFLANITEIDTVFDFRMADLANDGQGAPLTPVFHQLMLSQKGVYRFVLNLGGIANLTVINDKGQIVAGYDCGPANTLIDLACRELFDKPYDKGGKLAAKGKVDEKLITELFLRHQDFFYMSHPKSTGRELFNIKSIEKELKLCRNGKYPKHDLIATLAAFSVRAAVNELMKFDSIEQPKRKELVLCGGGANNPFIIDLFGRYLSKWNFKIERSSDLGIDVDYFEAQAFAYFAYLFVHGISLDLGSITGARKKSLLGCLAPSSQGFYAKSRSRSKGSKSKK